MSEEKPKSRWDKERQRWIHPDLPTATVSKKKRGRPRSQREDGVSVDAPDQDDQRYNAAIAAIDRKHKQWEADEERKYGSITFRDEHGNLVRDEQGKLVIGMSERFAELLLIAKAAGDLVPYEQGDSRAFVASTDPTQAWGWRDEAAAAKYGAAV